MWSRFDFLVLINFCCFKSKNRFTDVSHMKNLLKMSFIVKKKKNKLAFYTQILTILVAKKRASILLICLPPFFQKKNCMGFAFRHAHAWLVAEVSTRLNLFLSLFFRHSIFIFFLPCLFTRSSILIWFLSSIINFYFIF